jgi:hypothetical protein
MVWLQRSVGRRSLPDLAAGWRTWAAAEDGWFAVLHGELLCRVAA